MRILVTSGNGLTGSWIKHLSNKLDNHQFFFHDRSAGDLTNPNIVKRILKNIAPDLIIHNAASLNGALDKLVEKQKSASSNLLIFNNLLEFVPDYQKVYCFSSYHVYQDNPPFKELNIELLNHLSPYSDWKSKEIWSTQNLSNFSFILFPHLFGPYDNFNAGRAHFVADLIRRIYISKKKNYNEIEFYGDENQVIQLATGEQAAEFSLRQIQCNESTNNKYIRANVGWVVKTEFVFKALLEIMEFKGEVVKSNKPIIQTYRDMYFENEVSISDTMPNDFYESLLETVNFFKKTIENYS